MTGKACCPPPCLALIHHTLFRPAESARYEWPPGCITDCPAFSEVFYPALHFTWFQQFPDEHEQPD